MSMQTFETKRLTLRSRRESDAGALFKCASDGVKRGCVETGAEVLCPSRGIGGDTLVCAMGLDYAI